MNTFQHMITAQYPYAVPGEDFTVKTGEDGHPAIGYWNAEKLGPEPSLTTLHANYMRWAMRKKEMLPKFDDSDPAPWLNKRIEERTEVSRTIAQEANEDQNLCHGAVCIYPNGTITRRVR